MKVIGKLLSTFSLLLLAAACKTQDKQTNAPLKDDVIPVRVMQLQQQQGSNTIFVAGQFTTDDETILSFKTGGVIERIFVKEGDAVKRGQLLATLHLTEINAAAQQAVLGYQKAQRDYDRASRLFKDSVATLEQMQNAKTALDVAKQQADAAQFNRNYSEIRATADGFILKKFTNEGQMAGPGSPVLQANGAAKNNWLFKAGVGDQQWSSLKTGDKASIQTDALPGQQIAAEVFKKSEGLDPQTGTFIIQLKVNGTPSGLASGLFGRATITPSAGKASLWSIPYEAVLDGNNNEGYVFITRDNKTAQKIKVTISSIENGHILVSSGLENSGTVIVSGSAYLDEGSMIKIVK